MSPPESIPSSKYNNVELIPWDADSDIHAQRLYEQRVACTWDEDLIEEWRTRVRDGNKFFYWIVRLALIALCLTCFFWLVVRGGGLMVR